MRLFENKVLRKIFEPMRDETTKEWRRLHNEKLYDLYSSPNSDDQIENNEMYGVRSTYGGEQSCIQDFGGET